MAGTDDDFSTYIPFTLPGEMVRATIAAKRGDGWAGVADAILTPSPQRVAAPCPHFGTCGGCVLQHWEAGPYGAWKVGQLEAALRRAGFGDTPLEPLVTPSPGLRRRIDLAVRRHPGGVTLGLHRHRSADVVDLSTCLVLAPALVALFAPLRELLRRLNGLKREASAVINLLDTGPDILLRLDGPLSTPDRTLLAAFANTHGAPRITTSSGAGLPETACLLRPPVIEFSGVNVTPPPGAFLQASADGQAAIIAAVLAGLPAKLSTKAKVAELYAGCGTLTFALAQRARVAAYEGDAPAAASLKAAADAAMLTGRVTVERRDLARQPLAAKEFKPFAAVVLDPPHGGAAVQVAQIAASGVARVIYVSCNPAALNRDALTLKQAGYKLLSATPIDQFRWSARLESVCVFIKT